MCPDNSDLDFDVFDDDPDSLVDACHTAELYAQEGAVAALRRFINGFPHSHGWLATSALCELNPFKNTIISEYLTFRKLAEPDEIPEDMESLARRQLDRAWRDLYCVVKLLLFMGADVNAQDCAHDSTALHKFSRYAEASEIVRLLLKSGADPAILDKNGATPLSYAVAAKCSENVRTLLELGANPNERTAYHKYRSAVAQAACNDSIELLNMLIAAGADVNLRDREGRTAIMIALLHNEEPEAVVSILLAAGADLALTDNHGFCAADYAISEIGFVMEAPTQIPFDQIHYEIVAAARDGKVWKLAQYQLGTVHRRILNLALFNAAKRGHIDAADVLLKLGADINGVEVHGVAPVIAAVFYLRSAMVRFLVKHGADVNCKKPHDGRSPLHIICTRLLPSESRAAEKLPALHLELTRLLIESGADVNARDNNEATPLYWAVYSGFYEVVSLLFTHGADATMPDKWGLTPIKLAEKSVRMRALVRRWLHCQ